MNDPVPHIQVSFRLPVYRLRKQEQEEDEQQGTHIGMMMYEGGFPSMLSRTSKLDERPNNYQMIYAFKTHLYMFNVVYIYTYTQNYKYCSILYNIYLCCFVYFTKSG